MRLNYDTILFFSPSLFIYVGVQVVKPPFSALFAYSTRQKFSDIAPVFCAVLLNLVYY